MDLEQRFSATKAELDKISPTFCLAKWLQVTIHLQNGFNHSCHHPNLHKIPLEELERDPSALHNTIFKKEQRRLMIAGERPPECEYCWKVEDTKGNHYSDRVHKSSDPWALPKLKEIAETPYHRSVSPTYVEVSFGSECNFRCAYCNPYTSSKIWSHFQKHGPYVARESLAELEAQGKKPYGPQEKNPYVAAFWKWFPDALKELKVFRITGGEPLVNANTFQVLDFLSANPAPHLELCINSNLGIPDARFEEFLEKVKKLTKEKKICRFNLFTSVDSHGKQAEYLRIGLNYDKWKRNVEKYLATLPWKLTFMVTFNALSPPRFNHLLEDIHEINSRTFGSGMDNAKNRTYIDISHLMYPEYFSSCILTPEWREKVGELVAFMAKKSKAEVGAAGFEEFEVHKLQRIHSWIQSSDWASKEARLHRGRFHIFSEQYEKRDGVKFLESFPEMEAFFDQCRNDRASEQ